MNESFHFENVDLFTVGTLGPKGQRVFYLQCRAGSELVSLESNKQQVSALAECLERVLSKVVEARAEDPPGDLDLREPVRAAWRIGTLHIGYDPAGDRVMIAAEELTEDDDAIAARARFSLTYPQAIGLIEKARIVVAAGRPPCRYCGQPLEVANAGWCPCHN